MGISELTALELGKEIKEKQISVREAVQASLERIHKYEDTVHAYVTLTEEAALAQADEIQKQIDDGILTGPLAGVPMAIKDNICTEGIEDRQFQNFKGICTSVLSGGSAEPQKSRCDPAWQDKYG